MPEPMKSQRRIYVDLDDVLCETARGFLALLEKEFDRRVDFDQIVSFDLSDSFALDRSELEEFMRRAHRNEVLLDLDPIEGAVGTLEHWIGEGYEVAVVTGRPPSTAAVSDEWLKRHRVPHHELIFLAKYAHSTESGDGPEPRPLAQLSSTDYCLAVEDSLDMAVYLAETAGISVSLLDRPWNRRSEASGGEAIVRCASWQELQDRFPRP
jgi:uncharacterized HAD superfamily protein